MTSKFTAESNQSTDPEFVPGDRVTDALDADRPSMRVLRISEHRASQCYIKALGKTVAEVNDCDPEDLVYEVAFESHLDSHVPNWDGRESRLIPPFVFRYAAEWKVPIQRYNYPESRLEAKADDPDE